MYKYFDGVWTATRSLKSYVTEQLYSICLFQVFYFVITVLNNQKLWDIVYFSEVDQINSLTYILANNWYMYKSSTVVTLWQTY